MHPRWLLGWLLVTACTGPVPVPDDVVAPVITAASVSPGAPQAGSTLTAMVDVDAEDGAALRYLFAWSLDGDVVRRTTEPSVALDLSKGQTVGLSVSAWADDVPAEPFDAAPVVVVNTPPVPLGTLLNGAPRAWVDPLVCSPQSVVDADDDPVTWTFAWTVNDAPYAGATASTNWPGDTVPADVLREGQTWTCVAIASDGDAQVATQPARAVVAVGVPPVIGRPVAGLTFSCVLQDDLEVVCWGEDGEHRKSTPPAGPFVRVYPGGQFACALRADDLFLDCWGDPRNGATEPPQEPVVDAALGLDHGCALRPDGTITCWGYNDRSQLDAPTGVFRAVFAGFQNSCALDALGHAMCWGAGYAQGQRVPTDVSFVQLAIGGDHGCGLVTDGSVRCWGSNIYGQATPPSTARGRFLAVAARLSETCALREDGAVVCWGESDLEVSLNAQSLSMKLGLHACVAQASGQIACISTLDDGIAGAYGEDVPPYEDFVAFSAGNRIACGIDRTGRTSCVGPFSHRNLPSDSLGVLATGSDIACGLRVADNTAVCWGSTTGTGLDLTPTDPLLDMGVGYDLACGRKLDGTVLCWGNYPVNVPDGTFSQVVVADRYACGLRGDGTIACWGRNDNRTRPPEGTFVSLDADVDHACAMRADRSVACWGIPYPPDDQAGPYTTVSVAQGNACGLTPAGALRCWGRNAFGIVSPPASLPLVELDGGGERQCGLDAGGGMWCWGLMRRQPLQMP